MLLQGFGATKEYPCISNKILMQFKILSLFLERSHGIFPVRTSNRNSLLMLTLLMSSKVVVFVRRPMKYLLDALWHSLYAIIELSILLGCFIYVSLPENLNLSSVFHAAAEANGATG
jgi:hypothetical protein